MVVTRDEMEAGLKADFAAADTNGDGCLTAEVRPDNNRRLAQDGAAASPLRDWNLDGCVDIKEFSTTAHSYFDLVDKKKDGKVTLLELRGPSMPIAPPARYRSRQEHTFGEKMRSAMRFGFGGHIEGGEAIDPEPKQPRSEGRSGIRAGQ
jgi:hypothetical protein